MSKELVARALEHLVDGYVLSRAVLDDFDRSLTHISLGAPALAALIRAVDAMYPEGYDEGGGFLGELRDATEFDADTLRICTTCYRNSHEPHGKLCHRWNTRVALLALCRDITGEKG